MSVGDEFIGKVSDVVEKNVNFSISVNGLKFWGRRPAVYGDGSRIVVGDLVRGRYVPEETQNGYKLRKISGYVEKVSESRLEAAETPKTGNDVDDTVKVENPHITQIKASEGFKPATNIEEPPRLMSEKNTRKARILMASAYDIATDILGAIPKEDGEYAMVNSLFIYLSRREDA